MSYGGEKWLPDREQLAAGAIVQEGAAMSEQAQRFLVTMLDDAGRWMNLQVMTPRRTMPRQDPAPRCMHGQHRGHGGRMQA